MVICMQLQMEEAVNLEDFKEAWRIKKTLAVVLAQDPVARVMSDFKVQHLPDNTSISFFFQDFSVKFKVPKH